MTDVLNYHGNRSWIRASENKVFAGVCEGLGKSFHIQPNLMRFFWLASMLFLGTGLLFYVILAFVLPRDDQLEEYEQNKILGVCSRISKKLDIELALVRLIAVLSLFVSLGFSIFVYLVLHFVLPEEHYYKQSMNS